MISMWFFVWWSFSSLMHHTSIKKTIGYVADDRDFMQKENQLPSMTSKRRHRLVKLLMLIGVSIQQRISLLRYHRLTLQLNSYYGWLKPKLEKNGATHLRNNGDVRFYLSARALEPWRCLIQQHLSECVGRYQAVLLVKVVQENPTRNTV